MTSWIVTVAPVSISTSPFVLATRFDTLKVFQMGAFQNGCAKIQTWNRSPTVKWSLVLMVRGSCDLYWRPQLSVALDRLGTMEFCNTCFLVNTCKVYFVSLSPKHVARLHVLLGWNRREQKAQGASRCLQLTRWVTVEPLHSSEFGLPSNMWASPWTTRLQTKQNKPIKYDRTRLQNGVRTKWAVGVRDVRLFCSVCLTLPRTTTPTPPAR